MWATGVRRGRLSQLFCVVFWSLGVEKTLGVVVVGGKRAKYLILVPVVVLLDLGSASRFAHDDLSRVRVLF